VERHSVDTRPYWEALQQKQLVIQKCGECGKHRHYPQPMCPHCHSTAVEWKQVSGNGTVHSWTIVYQTGIPGFVEQVPYAFVTVDLPEGVRVAAPLRQVGPEDIRIGLPVTLVFETAQDGTVVLAYIAATGIS
jgi:uncharacterized protein